MGETSESEFFAKCDPLPGQVTKVAEHVTKMFQARAPFDLAFCQ